MKNRDRARKWIGCVTGVILLGMTGGMMTTYGLAISDSETAGGNEKEDFCDLKSFSAVTLEKELVTEKLLQEKDVTIMNIWGTYCGPCINEMPELAEFANGLEDNVQFITFCVDGYGLEEEVAAFLEQSGFDQVVTLVGCDGDLQTLMSRVMYVPTTFFFDREGTILVTPLIGSPSDVQAIYTQLLENAMSVLETEAETTSP